MQKIILGSAAALGFVAVAIAQIVAPANAGSTPASAAAAPVSAIPGALRSHLSPGAPIYLGDKAIASVHKVADLTGYVVIAQTAEAGKPAPAKRIVSASDMSWSNGKLAINLTTEAINQLPTY